MHISRRRRTGARFGTAAVERALVPAMLLLAAACAVETVGETRAELVNPAAPPLEAGLAKMTPLAAELVYTGGAVQDTSPTAVHDGLATGWIYTSKVPSNNPVTWQLGVVNEPHASTSAFVGHLKQRESDASAHLNSLDAGTAGDLLTLLDSIGGYLDWALTVRPGAQSTAFRGYPKIHARWRDSEYAQPTTPPPSQPETNYQYADPYVFENIRQRGARLYCAARAARVEQASTGADSLGGVQILETPILGTSIGWLRSEAFATLWDPTRPASDLGEPGGDDGAQAFGVPMTLGLVLRPTTLLPSMSEIRIPVVLTSGESEIRTPTNWRPIHTGCAPGSPCTPAYVNGWAQTYQTVTHADSIRSAHVTGGSMPMGFDANIPLAVLGPFVLNFTAHFNLSIGVSSTDDSRLLRDFPTVGTPGRPLYAADWGAIRFFDGPWRQRRTTDWLLVDAPSPTIAQVTPWPAMTHLRPRQNDDHAVDFTTTLELDAGAEVTTIGAVGGLGVTVTPSVEATLGVDWTHRFRLRDALRAERELGVTYPVGALTVHPTTSSSFDFSGVDLRLTISIALLFGESIDFTIEIPIMGGVPLWGWDSESPQFYGEGSRLRIGYDGPGEVRNQPYVHSHLPGSAEYVTFADETVDECLTEPPVDLPNDPRCDPRETPTVPSGAICLFADPTNRYMTPTAGVCANIDAYVNASFPAGPRRECIRQTLLFFCQPVSMQQTWQGKTVVARVIENTPAFWSQFKSLSATCVDAFVPSHDPVSIDQFGANYFGGATCDATNAQLYSTTDPPILTPTTPESSCP
jgi:hypothetical protein